MEVSFLLTADYASLTNDKLNVLGVFQNIWAVTFPHVHYLMYLVLSLDTEQEEAEQIRNVTISLLSEHGNELGKITANMQIPIPQAGRKPQISAVFELRSITFPKPGTYEFVVYIEGEEHKRLPLYLTEKPAGEGA